MGRGGELDDGASEAPVSTQPGEGARDRSSIRRRQEPRSLRQRGCYRWAGRALLSHSETAPDVQELCTQDAPAVFPSFPFPSHLCPPSSQFQSFFLCHVQPVSKEALSMFF